MRNSLRSFAGIFILLVLVSGAAAEPKGGIPESLIGELVQSPLNGNEKTMADIIANKSIKDIALNRERYIDHNSFINHTIKTGGITNQKSSGRCWMFAGFNVIRPQVIKKYNLKSFEFSENYLLFWDKMEKYNKFLQLMIDFAERPLDDRELAIVIEWFAGDGGWWTYFTDLMQKYGLVPIEVMPETHNSSSTGMMNSLIGLKTKQFGVELRNMVRDGSSEDEVMARKEEMLAVIYRMLVINLGQPPTEFTWRYEVDDSTGITTHPTTFTPKSFYEEVIDVDLNDYVALFNYPGKDYYENYSLRMSRNMYDRPNFTVLNIPIDTMRVYAQASVLDSTPVWFACDVGKENYGKDGIMALDIYNYESIYGVEFDLPKADLIQMQLITPNHAMAFMGVDTANGEVEKWLVENSWGDERGDKGKWYMYNDWFDRYMFGVIVHKDYLSPGLIELSEKKPIELPPWDPMYGLNNLR
jgi:bleomycin hydrolase